MLNICCYNLYYNLDSTESYRGVVCLFIDYLWTILHNLFTHDFMLSEMCQLNPSSSSLWRRSQNIIKNYYVTQCLRMFVRCIAQSMNVSISLYIINENQNWRNVFLIEHFGARARLQYRFPFTAKSGAATAAWVAKSTKLQAIYEWIALNWRVNDNNKPKPIQTIGNRGNKQL